MTTATTKPAVAGRKKRPTKAETALAKSLGLSVSTMREMHTTSAGRAHLVWLTTRRRNATIPDTRTTPSRQVQRRARIIAMKRQLSAVKERVRKNKKAWNRALRQGTPLVTTA